MTVEKTKIRNKLKKYLQKKVDSKGIMRRYSNTNKIDANKKTKENYTVGRLNGVVFLVVGFKELSYVTKSFLVT